MDQSQRYRTMVGAIRASIGASVFGVMIASCGGGGSDGPLIGGDEYIEWNDSANGSTIKDANNDSFAVYEDSRGVFAIDRDTDLTGLFVNDRASVIHNNVQIGSVVLDTSTSGSRIAVFRCNDGRAMDILVSGNGWSHNCSSSGGTNPPPTGTPPPTGNPPGGNNNLVANSCVSTRQKEGFTFLVNNCNRPLIVGFCYINDSSILACTIPDAQGNYVKGAAIIQPGAESWLVDIENTSGAAWFSCFMDQNGDWPLPAVTQINPVLGGCME